MLEYLSLLFSYFSYWRLRTGIRFLFCCTFSPQWGPGSKLYGLSENAPDTPLVSKCVILFPKEQLRRSVELSSHSISQTRLGVAAVLACVLELQAIPLVNIKTFEFFFTFSFYI